MNQDLNRIVQFLLEHRSFAILSHARPDGDSLGSSLALGEALTQLGKTAQVIQADPVPSAYESLPGVETIRHLSEVTEPFDSVLLLECNQLERTGLQRVDCVHVINIDHHSDTDPFADLNWVDSGAAAVAELVYELILAMGVTVTPSIATNLYAGILTDTGAFQFSNTTEHTFRVASALVSAGARPAEIARSVYMTQPLSRLRLLVSVLGTLEIHASKPIAWIHMTQKMLEQAGASRDQTEGLVNYPLSLKGVLVVAFFREESEAETRVSLRSKDSLNVAAIAQNWGGGGHSNAAGLTVPGPLRQAIQEVIRELDEQIPQQ